MVSFEPILILKLEEQLLPSRIIEKFVSFISVFCNTIQSLGAKLHASSDWLLENGRDR